MALGKRDLPATLQRKGTIIRLVTKRLTRKSGSVNQDVIGAVACLAMYEVKFHLLIYHSAFLRGPLI